MDKYCAAPNVDGDILSVYVEETTVNVRVQADNCCGYNFSDSLNMIKVNGDWLIINKIFNHM